MYTFFKCSKYSTNDLKSFDIELCTKEYKQINVNTELFDFESFFSNFTNLANQVVATGLKRFDKSAIPDSQTDETLVKNRFELSDSNLVNLPDYGQESDINSDLFATNNIHSSEQNNFNFYENNNSSNTIGFDPCIINNSTNSQITTQPVVQQQHSGTFFDENFFTEINNFLSGDYNAESETNIHATQANTSKLPLDSTGFDWLDFNGDTQKDKLDLNDATMDLDKSNVSSLETLKPINKSELAAKLASDVYSNDFLKATLSSNEPTNFKSSWMNTTKLKPQFANKYKPYDRLKKAEENEKVSEIREKSSLIKHSSNINMNSNTSNSKPEAASGGLLPWEIKAKDLRSKLKCSLYFYFVKI